MTVENRNCRLLLLQPETDSLSLDDPNSFIVLPWTRCIHWGRKDWGTNEKVARFISDCALFARGAVTSRSARLWESVSCVTRLSATCPG